MLPEQITVSLPQASGAPATSATIPITVTSLTGLGVQAYDFTLVFDQNVLQPSNPSFDTAGTLSSNMTITPNTGTPGRLVVSAFGTTALSGSGTLINLKFNVVGAAGAMTSLTFQSFVFNEGTPSATLVNGGFTITGAPACPTVSGINPTSGPVGTNVVITGNNVTGVTAVRFFNNLTASFTVNGNTQITATVPVGATTGPITISKPSCTDVQTSTFTVTDGCVPVAISTNLSAGSGATLIVPVTVGSLTGLGVTAYDLVLTFNAGVLTPASPAFDTAGTLSSGMTITPNTGASGQITVSAFGTTPLSGTGTLINLRLTVTGGASTCSDLAWTSFSFNEGIPCSTTTNGRACVAGVRTPFDFDADRKSDLSVWRPTTGVWFITNSSTGMPATVGWGVNGDQIVPGDYDGDGKSDVAVWRVSTGVWFIINSSNGSMTTTGWGLSTDVATPGDYDGDGKTDIAVWRPSSGTWFIINSSNGSVTTTVWGVNGDLPAAGDYDGDGKTDVAVWRPSTGVWFIVRSSNGTNTSVGWGVSGDKIVPGDYDGDGKTDVAVWRPSTGVWFVINSSNGAMPTTGWGLSTDVPVPGDYDGDGKTDVAVWRPSSGTWFIINSSNGSVSTMVWGVNGDVPVPSAFVRP